LSPDKRFTSDYCRHSASKQPQMKDIAVCHCPSGLKIGDLEAYERMVPSALFQTQVVS
jgi:hypothetical protein